MIPVIKASDLVALNKSDFILFDVSAGSKSRFEEAHLEGAIYMDLNTDLARIDDLAVGGRHPLPDLEDFYKLLEFHGVQNDSHVILYDDKNGANAAARLWWMLRSIGHEKVQVVSGGYQAALAAGFPISSEIVSKAVSTYVRNNEWRLNTATIDEVAQESVHADNLIIDVRDADRFAGLTEPIDLIAGHIPGATNVPFTENLDAQGLFLEPEVLRKKYEEVFRNRAPEDSIVHCGSGVTACHTLLALDYAGFPIPKWYVGSWSEWSRNDKPMVTIEN
jgi:thiosulfate/3-mercaptopyruvate sulfurtransferase